MPEPSVLVVFISTFFFISLSPGLCMSLAMSLGMAFGLKKTLYMMIGELVGVATVAILAVIGVAAIMLRYPDLFTVLKWIGGIFLIYVGINTIRRDDAIELKVYSASSAPSKANLFMKGFITAIANPKGWAFMISIFPPFIDDTKPITLQMVIFISVIMITEFTCMLLYASGGNKLRKILDKTNNTQWINRIGGGLLVAVGIWLALT